jgi:hypothetical protein
MYAASEHDWGQALVVGYAKPPEHAFTAAVARLVAVLERSRTSSLLGSRRYGISQSSTS